MEINEMHLNTHIHLNIRLVKIKKVKNIICIKLATFLFSRRIRYIILTFDKIFYFLHYESLLYFVI